MTFLSPSPGMVEPLPVLSVEPPEVLPPVVFSSPVVSPSGSSTVPESSEVTRFTISPYKEKKERIEEKEWNGME